MPYRDKLPVPERRSREDQDEGESANALELELATPCVARWDEMHGDDRVRHCHRCSRNVYDIAALTRAEVVELIEAHENRVCIRFFRRHDGTVLARDCSDGIRVRMRPEQILLWVMLILVGSVSLTLVAMECARGHSLGGAMRVAPRSATA